MAPYTTGFSKYMWKPISERPEHDKALDNEAALARLIGLKGWFLLRISMESHLKRVDRDYDYERRHEVHCELDDVDLMEDLYHKRLVHFEYPASSKE
jgi:hypothetical protein